jgi:hypothetical protein
MKMIPAENVRNFISAIENIFYTLHLGDETWNEFDVITDLHLGCNIRDTSRDEIPEEIAIIWHIEDVQCIRPDLTNEKASEVLIRLKKNHDATVGINWDTIETVADILFPADVPEIACKEGSL